MNVLIFFYVTVIALLIIAFTLVAFFRPDDDTKKWDYPVKAALIALIWPVTLTIALIIHFIRRNKSH